MRKFIFIKTLSFWIVLLCFVTIFIGQSYGGEIMPSSKKMEEELRQAVTEAGYRFEWRTLTNGGLGYLVFNFPEGKIVRDIEGSRTLAVSLSPDGTQVAFFQARSSSIQALVEAMDLMLEDINTGEQHSLGLIARGTSCLAWSPDGKRLALMAYDASTDLKIEWSKISFFEEPTRPSKLFIFSITDKSLDEFDVLLPDGFTLSTDQIWSPKGDEILYTVFHNKKPPLDIEIRILSFATGNTRSLGRGSFPTWSLTRNKIVFQDPNENYYLINPDGSGKTLLLKPNPKNVYDLIDPILWSPDGRWLLVPRGSSYGMVDLFIMDPESKVMIKIESQTQPRSSWKGRIKGNKGDGSI